ncbi:hypothetical protein CDCA_CDCA15G4004 [Cyanidium caldarium]|uniref:4-hydroxy-tetrahydrodipicolinate synthase n=1 Tax=Cyanidium caldarium TaxID=2771 RepID=A0AAV9J0Z4_CYACA|nr:hypothetical protein CDCA_CDCA15G4004 [Cyanidium caldarium]
MGFIQLSWRLDTRERKRRWLRHRRVCHSVRMEARPTPTAAAAAGVQPRERVAAAAPPTKPLFGHVVTAMVTPFSLNSAEVDFNVAESLAAHLAENGSDAIIVAGTTGESPTLTWAEEYELFRVVRSAVAGTGCKVIAGAGSNSTEEAVEATRKSARLGLDGTLQVVPYYNKPPQRGIYEHFRAIALAEPDLPMMLYNIPGRTGINMLPDTTMQLARDFPNIVAVKEATGDMDQFAKIRNGTDASSFALYSGDDGLTLPLLALGGSGAVSVASHFIGKELQAMVQAFQRGAAAEALRIHCRYMELFTALFVMANPIPAKAALRLQGWSVGVPRLPLTDITPEAEAKLRAVMTQVGLLRRE